MSSAMIFGGFPVAGRFSQVLEEYRRHFRRYDLLLSIGIAFLALAISQVTSVFGWPSPGNADLDVRRSLYITGATIAGSLLGFVIAAITIALALPPVPSVKLLQSSRHYPEIFKTFVSATRYLALDTGVCLVLLLLDTQASISAAVGAFLLWLIVVTSLRLARCVWLLSQLLQVVAAPTQ